MADLLSGSEYNTKNFALQSKKVKKFFLAVFFSFIRLWVRRLLGKICPQ